MSDSISAKWVVCPKPGELLRLWGLEPRVSWYPVHELPRGRAAPHTPRDCAYCADPGWAPPIAWEGYLLCCVADMPRRTAVIRLPAWLYDLSTDLQRGVDCRQGLWIYTRAPGRHLRALSLQWVMEPDSVLRSVPVGFTHWWLLLEWWVLPQSAPDYRLSVYVDLMPRSAPDEDADVIDDRKGVPS